MPGTLKITLMTEGRKRTRILFCLTFVSIAQLRQHFLSFQDERAWFLPNTYRRGRNALAQLSTFSMKTKRRRRRRGMKEKEHERSNKKCANCSLVSVQQARFGDLHNAKFLMLKCPTQKGSTARSLTLIALKVALIAEKDQTKNFPPQTSATTLSTHFHLNREK